MVGVDLHTEAAKVCTEADKSPAIGKADNRGACTLLSTMQHCAQIDQPILSFQTSVLLVEHGDAL